MSNTNNLYGLPQPLTQVFPSPIRVGRAPLTTDIHYQIGQQWIDTAGDDAYILVDITAGSATWSVMAITPGNVDTLTGDTGGALTPTAGNLNVLGTNTVQVTGSGSTLTVNPRAGGYPNTPYVVGGSGKAGYTTIATAITAATATGGVIYIQPGTYTEDLTLVNGVMLVGDSVDTVTITGVHTPPASGEFNAENITFTSATDILNSSAAGTATLAFVKCNFTVTNGYTFNVANWTGSLVLSLCGEVGSTTNGIVNNTTTAPIGIFNSVAGAGTAKPMLTKSSLLSIDDSEVVCPITVSGGCVFSVQAGSIIDGTFTTANTASGSFQHSTLNTGSAIAFTHGSSGTVAFNNVVVTSTASPAVFTGAGAGALSINEVVFTNEQAFAATLTVDDTVAEVSAGHYTTSNMTTWIDWTAHTLAAGGAGADVGIALTPKGAGVVTIATGGLTATAGPLTATNGNVILGTAGNKLVIKTGANASIGTSSALSSGSVAVATTAVDASSIIILSRATAGGTPGFLSVGAINPGTSFAIISSGASDTSTVNWWIVD